MARTLEIDDFSYGLITDPDAATLPRGAAQVADDVVIEGRQLRARPGRTVAAAAPSHLSTVPRASCPFVIATAQPEAHHRVGVIGTRVYWTIRSVDLASNGVAAWQSGTAYSVGDLVVAVTREKADYIYACTTAGTSHSSEPTWGTTPEGTTTDNTVTWTCHRNPTAKRWLASTAYTQGEIVRPLTHDGYVYECTTAGTTAAGEPTWTSTTTTSGTAVFTRRTTLMYEEIDSSVTVHATNLVSLVQSGDKLYLTDGSSAVRRLDRWGDWFTLTEFERPTDIDVATNINLPILLATDYSTCKFGSPTPQGYYLNSSGTAYTYTTRTPYKWRAMEFPQSGPDHPDTTHVQGWTAMPVPYTDLQFTEATGRMPRACVALDIVKKASYAADDLDCGDIGLGYQFQQAASLAGATALTFWMYVQSGTNTPVPAGASTLHLYWGETANIADKDDWTYVSVDLTDLTAAGNATWVEFTVDISAYTDTEKNQVYWIGWKFTDLTISWTATRYGDGEFTGWYDGVAGAQFIFSPIFANYSDANFLQASYWFTYTLGKADEDGDGVDEESGQYYNGADAQDLYPSLTFNAAIPQSVTITAYKPTGSDATYATFYASGGTTMQFRKLGTDTFDVNGEATFTWDGSYSDIDITVLPEYIGRPPAGSTLMVRHNNRMVYVAPHPNDPDGPADVLYFSDDSNVERVPILPSSLTRVPSTRGGWIDTERYGHSITGLVSYGSALYAFKRRGMFEVLGQPGMAADARTAFIPRTLDPTIGCISPRSLIMADGALYWLDEHMLMRFDGDGPRPIATHIRPTLDGYSLAAQEDAISLFDPVLHRLYLIVPDTGTPDATPGSTLLLLDLRLGDDRLPFRFVRWTGQPGACGCYDQWATTPGIYLCDLYGTGGRAKEYLVDATATTDANADGTTSAIDWTWVSGEVGRDGQYLSVERMAARVIVADATPEVAYTLTLGYRPHNDSAYDVTKNATVTRLVAHTEGGAGAVEWRPAPRGEMGSCALLLSRATTDVIAVRTLQADLATRGRAVGRTT